MNEDVEHSTPNEPMTLSFCLSDTASPAARLAWQKTVETMGDRLAEDIGAAGGMIHLGDCGRHWCIGGTEHTQFHVSRNRPLGDTLPTGTWWGYLLQRPGDTGFATTQLVFDDEAGLEFEMPAWQVVVLRDILEDPDGRHALSALLQLASDAMVE